MSLSFVHSVLALSSKRAPITISTMGKKRMNDGTPKKIDEPHVQDATDGQVWTPDKKFDTTKGAYTGAEKRSMAKAYWTRVASGKKESATDEEIKDAKTALKLLDDLSRKDQMNFAELFCQGKETKDFAFIKEFQEKFQARKEQSKTTMSNLMTRIFF